MAAATVKIYRSGERKPEASAPGVLSRGLAASDKVMMFETEIKAGSERPLHAHPHDQIGYVARGEIELVVGGQPHVCKAGDSFSILGGVRHSIRARQDALIIDAFNQVAQTGGGDGQSNKG